MTEKKKSSAAHMRATKKYEDKSYFKALVRFKSGDESRIRRGAELMTGGSLNGYIVRAVLAQMERDGITGDDLPTGSATDGNGTD